MKKHLLNSHTNCASSMEVFFVEDSSLLSRRNKEKGEGSIISRSWRGKGYVIHILF